jgi:hypothetical protein
MVDMAMFSNHQGITCHRARWGWLGWANLFRVWSWGQLTWHTRLYWCGPSVLVPPALLYLFMG